MLHISYLFLHSHVQQPCYIAYFTDSRQIPRHFQVLLIKVISDAATYLSRVVKSCANFCTSEKLRSGIVIISSSKLMSIK